MSENQDTRKLRAILHADVKGYSRLMGEDESYTVNALRDCRKLFSAKAEAYGGRIVNAPGDSVLAEFPSVLSAVQCAVEIQNELSSKYADVPNNRKMAFRIGINLGDVIHSEDGIYGDGVNIAARIEALAEPGGVSISKNVFNHVHKKLKYGFEYQGEHQVKNITDPVRVYKVLLDPADAGKIIGVEPKPKAGKWIWPTIVLASIILTIFAYQLYQKYSAPEFEAASVEKMAFPLPDKPSIAVLAFDNMTGDPSQEYFSDGLSEEIITVLSMTDELFVIARNSSFSYKNQPVKIQQISEELGVRYVLEGSVRKSGDRVRITAQLIDAVEGRHLWAESYDRDFENILEIQDEISMRVVSSLQVKLTEGEQRRILRDQILRPEVFKKHLQALAYIRKGTREGLERYGQLGQEIVDIAPESPIGYRLLGWYHYSLAHRRESPKENIKMAFEMADKALAIDASDGFTHGLMSYVYMKMKKYEEAITSGKRSVALQPSSADAHWNLGATLAYAGRFEEGTLHLKQAMRLNPIPPYYYYYNMGNCYLFMGQPENALGEYMKATKRAPKWAIGHLMLAIAYVYLDRYDEAQAEKDKAMELQPNLSLSFVRKISKFKNPTHTQYLVDAMRKAGFPENYAAPIPEKPSIAVLAFDNMSGDPSQEYFSDSISENIITALSKIGEIFVIARNSSFTYKGKPVKIQQIGRELGVRYVLEGSVQISGDRVRITTQLIDARKGHHLWSEKYDRNLKDLFALQDEITLKVIRAMQVQLTEGEQARVTGKGTKNLDAYLKAIQAFEQFYRMNKDGSMKSKELAKEAIVLDPNYAFPYASLANAHMLDVWFNFTSSPKESMRLAAQAAQKALTLDNSDPRVFSALTNLYIMQRQYDKAIVAAERQIELSPNSAQAHRSMGIALYFAERAVEAIPFIEHAIRLDPYPSAITFRNLASAYRMAGRYEEAVTAYKKALQKNPDDIFTHILLSVTYVKLGLEKEAKAEAKEVTRIYPKFSIAQFTKGQHMKDRPGLDELIECMRKAGLPE